MIKGIGASAGIAIGEALVIKEHEIKIDKQPSTNDMNIEIERFNEALREAEAQLNNLKEIAEKKLGNDKAKIFEAHILILNDPEFINNVKNKIKEENSSAEFALTETIKFFKSVFESMDNEYMRERASDIGDIGKRILNILTNTENTSIAEIDSECIVVTKDLTPSDTAQIDKSKVLAFVTDIGGKTSHSAIMARTLEVPAIVGTGNITSEVKNGDTLIVDGDEGIIIVNPEENLIKEYRNKQYKLLEDKKGLLKYVDLETFTKDGRRIEVASNIGNAKDAHGAMKNGADGVGLFRTEFIYMDKESLPTEDEQFEVYKEAAQIMGQRHIIVRTLDIGGDKKLPYLKIDEEMNPFLGYRAIRLCLDKKDIFKTQLRAILRASNYGNLKIMFPMISNISEIRAAKAVLEETKQELRNENIKFDEDIKVGIMIEIPSAAILSDLLAKEVDFFSIGTNDLIQYSVAVDRMNETVSYLYDAFNPGVLRLIKMVIENAHKHGKKVGMCGETAGNPKLIPIFLGFGLDEFSMSASSILKAKQQISTLSYKDCIEISNKVLSMETSDEIKEIMEEIT